MKQISKITGSASKLVLLMFAATVCVGVFTGHVPVDNVFAPAMTLVLGFYFGRQTATNTTTG